MCGYGGIYTRLQVSNLVAPRGMLTQPGVGPLWSFGCIESCGAAPGAPSPGRGRPVTEVDNVACCDVVSVTLADAPDLLCEHLRVAVAKSAELLRGVPGTLSWRRSATRPQGFQFGNTAPASDPHSPARPRSFQFGHTAPAPDRRSPTRPQSFQFGSTAPAPDRQSPTRPQSLQFGNTAPTRQNLRSGGGSLA